jgi:hypothetical protein
LNRDEINPYLFDNADLSIDEGINTYLTADLVNIEFVPEFLGPNAIRYVLNECFGDPPEPDDNLVNVDTSMNSNASRFIDTLVTVGDGGDTPNLQLTLDVLGGPGGDILDQTTAYSGGSLDGKIESAEIITLTTTTTIPDCVVDTDCEDDGIGCTDETCETGTCVSTPNNANCSDDGAFCNGTEFCDAALDCSSTGDPCELPAVCNEGTDTCVADEDLDEDGIPDNDDNCPNTTNPLQLDTYPPQGNTIGDACDCEGNFDCDQDCDGSDAATFKDDFGRSPFNEPCEITAPCNGDFDCDGDVDGTDAALFKSDFGRSGFNNPCPTCDGSPWCTYTTTTIPNGSACNPGDCGEGFCCCHIEGGLCGPSGAELCQTEEECADVAEFCLETVCLD